MKKLILLSQLSLVIISTVVISAFVRPARVSAAPPGDTFTVNSINDGSDANPGDGICETSTSGECTLRAAIEEANSNGNPSEQDIIGFDISGSGVHTISRTGNEYNISQNVLIDGYTTDGTTPNGSSKNTTASPAAFDAVLTIEIESSGANNPTNTILIGPNADGTTVKGLVLNASQAETIASQADDVSILGCYIGTDPTGLVKLETFGGGLTEFDSVNLHVGGTSPADRNIIAGSSQAYYSANATHPVFEGNYIDVGSDGLTPLSHTGTPTIVFLAGDSGAMVGGNTAASKNVINNSPGSAVSFESGAHDSQVAGNEIMGNAGGAVSIVSGSYNIMIGGSDASYANVMSDNYTGVSITGSTTHDITVMHNLIGTDDTGNSPLPNSNSGVVATDAAGVTISSNTISYNGGAGVSLNNNSDVTVDSNTITSSGGRGIESTDSDTVTVSNNLISGNTLEGLAGDNLDDSAIWGNLIGTNAAGTAAFGNGGDGISFANGSSSGNTIGGTTSNRRNVISGNTGSAIILSDSGTSNNTVSGNYIGVDTNGTAGIGNGSGVAILNGANNNTIGGATAASRNIVTNNNQGGISIVGGFGTPTTGNVVQSNYIGTDVNGDGVAWNNQVIGIGIVLDATDNLIGGESPSVGNLIRGATVGIYMVEVGDTFNPIRNPIIGNSIYENQGSYEQCVDTNFDFNCEVSVGPNVNDAGDPDSGPNDLENTPVITAATYTGNTAKVTFSLDAGDSPGGQYHVEFFASSADRSGQTYLGFVNVSNGNGQVASNLIIPDGFDMSGKYISATTTQYDPSFSVTDGYGSTSEFSAGVIPTLQATTVSNPVTSVLSDTGQNSLRIILFALLLITLGGIGLVARRKVIPKS